MCAADLASGNDVPVTCDLSGLCGGEACIGNTRIAVWMLEDVRRQGAGEEELLQDYPGLRSADLAAAWAYAREHPAEIENAIQANLVA